VSDNKLCGYVFARLEGEPWAYMLPIEPVFASISKHMSKESQLKVDVPDAATIETLKRALLNKLFDERYTSELRSRPSTKDSRESDGEPDTGQPRVSTHATSTNSIPLIDRSSKHIQLPSSVPRSRLTPQTNPIRSALADVSQGDLDRSTPPLPLEFDYSLQEFAPSASGRHLTGLPRSQNQNHLLSMWRRILGRDVSHPSRTVFIPPEEEMAMPLLAAIPSCSGEPVTVSIEPGPLAPERMSRIERRLKFIYHALLLAIENFQVAMVMMTSKLSWPGFQTIYSNVLEEHYASRRKYGTAITITLYLLRFGVPLGCIALICLFPFWTYSVDAKVLWLLGAAFMFIPRHYLLKGLHQWAEQRQMYMGSDSQNEQASGREVEREGIDLVANFPETVGDVEQLREAEIEVEALYQPRLATRRENEEREERRRLRREAREKFNLAALQGTAEQQRIASTSGMARRLGN
jgi:hypothetical protein